MNRANDLPQVIWRREQGFAGPPARIVEKRPKMVTPWTIAVLDFESSHRVDTFDGTRIFDRFMRMVLLDTQPNRGNRWELTVWRKYPARDGQGWRVEVLQGHDELLDSERVLADFMYEIWCADGIQGRV